MPNSEGVLKTLVDYRKEARKEVDCSHEIERFFDALLNEFVMADEGMLDDAMFAVEHLAKSAWSTPERVEHERGTMAICPRAIEKTQVAVEELCEIAYHALGAIMEEEIDFDAVCKKHLARLDEIKTIARDFTREKGIEEPSVEEWIRMALEVGAK